MADFMCAYGNCDSVETPIVVNDKNAGERNRFCCDEHAGLWFMRKAERTKAVASAGSSIGPNTALSSGMGSDG